MFDLKGLHGSESHKKLSRLLRYVIGRIPDDDLIELSTINVVLLLADKSASYHYPVYVSRHGEQTSEPIKVNLILLSPGIAERPEESAIYIIAHELSHAYLNHSMLADTEDSRRREIEADEQVIKWGFANELNSEPDNYIYGNGLKKLLPDRS
jgi:hypothetical protein